MKTNHRTWWFLGLFLAIVAACGGKPLKISYYSLTAINSTSQESVPVATTPDLTIGIGPVNLPENLNRTQILTRAGDNRLTYSEAHRWAGDVEKDISGTVRENISFLLGTERVVVYPWDPAFRPAYRIVLDFLEFNGVRGDFAEVNVRWAISDGKGKDLFVVKKARITEPTGGETYDALVKAQSKALAALSREIAEEIARLASSENGKAPSE